MEKIEHELSNFINLICGDNYFVSQCSKCGKIKFNYNNVMLDMNVEKYREFAKLLDSAARKNSEINDRERLVFINYDENKELSLVFDMEEFDEIRRIIHESILMLEVNSLIEVQKTKPYKS